MANSGAPDPIISPPEVGAIIVAAGTSRRMGGVDKIFARLLGQPLIYYSLKAFQDAPEVTKVVLVLSSDNVDLGRDLVDEFQWHKVNHVCTGGPRRQDSVRLGLEKLPESEWIVVHDGGRPLIETTLISRGLEEARDTGSAVAAVPVVDTIKLADSQLIVQRTLERDGLWATQTPQVFQRQILAEAHQRVSEEATDDAAMVERTGNRVRLFMGSYNNIKVTTPGDLRMAEAILRTRRSGGVWQDK